MQFRRDLRSMRRSRSYAGLPQPACPSSSSSSGSPCAVGSSGSPCAAGPAWGAGGRGLACDSVALQPPHCRVRAGAYRPARHRATGSHRAAAGETLVAARDRNRRRRHRRSRAKVPKLDTAMPARTSMPARRRRRGPGPRSARSRLGARRASRRGREAAARPTGGLAPETPVARIAAAAPSRSPRRQPAARSKPGTPPTRSRLLESMRC
jgi:hypothetical protein